MGAWKAPCDLTDWGLAAALYRAFSHGRGVGRLPALIEERRRREAETGWTLSQRNNGTCGYRAALGGEA